MNKNCKLFCDELKVVTTILFSNLNAKIIDFLLNKTVPSSILLYLLILSTVFLACYNLIIIPQKMQRQHLDLIQNRIKPGNKISTFNDVQGVITYILKNTVIIELKNGCKTEILKQSIKNIYD